MTLPALALQLYLPACDNRPAWMRYIDAVYQWRAEHPDEPYRYFSIDADKVEELLGAMINRHVMGIRSKCLRESSLVFFERGECWSWMQDAGAENMDKIMVKVEEQLDKPIIDHTRKDRKKA